MLEYPSISSEIQFGGPYFIWDKLDGQNIRTEWSKKQGFYKLGARRTHLDDRWRDEVYQLIEFQSDALLDGFRRQKWDRATCFFEFYSEKSLAGIFLPNDAKMIALLDVADPDGLLIDPRDFHKLFYGKVQTPKLLDRGNFNHDTYKAVKTSTYTGMTLEGVVVKGPGQQKEAPPVMFKCKSDEWFRRIRDLYGEERAKELL